jgi:tetratricopeptide (TPR) repeat protein
LHVDRENLLAAHAWCDHAPDGGQLGLKLAFELKDYWVHRGGLEPGYRVTTEALARPDAQLRNTARSWAEYTAALLASCMGRYAEALGHREACLSIARELGNKKVIIFALLSLGEHHVIHRQWPEARRYIEEAVPLAREHNGENERICALLALGDLDRLEGRLEPAEACNEECLAIARASSGQPRTKIVVLNNLSCLSLTRGSAEKVPAMLLEALDICEEIASRLLAAYTMMVASGLAAFRGESRRAATLHAAASRQLDELSYRFEPADEAFLAPLIAQAREALGEAASAAAEASGRALSYEAAMSKTREWLKAIEIA